MYPEELHDLHDLQGPLNIIPPNGKHSKLILNLYNKRNCYSLSKLETMTLTKIHKVLEFNQS